jgi:fucose 4-O-acetylase-like acetyltransferase
VGFKGNDTAEQASKAERGVSVIKPAWHDTTLSPLSSITAQNRSAWVDIARGIGIILVVYGHALRGHFPLADAESWQEVQDGVIYSFHMPLFFVLAGLFLWGSIEKNRRGFLAGRWEQMIYPYLLWSAVTAGIELPLSHFVNSPLSWHEVWQIPFKPIEQYWFLYALLVHQLIAAIAYPRKWLLPAAVIVGLALVSWLGGAWIVLRSMLYLPYLVVGMFAVPLLQMLARATFVTRASVAAGGWLAFAAITASSVPGADSMVRGYALGFSGSLGLIAAAMLLAPIAALSRPLVLLGQASLAIYVAHTIFSAGMRIALKLIGIAPETGISFLAANVVGLLFPLMLWRAATVQGWSHWIGFGRYSQTTTDTTRSL